MKNTKEIKRLDRRSFLQVSALAGGGVMIGLYAPSALSQGPGGPGGGRAPQAPAALKPSTYITVNTDNTFTIVGKNPETGQGIKNSLPMIIADEFDVSWNQVKVVMADLDGKYGVDAGAPQVRQIEGGSTATPDNYTPMRNVGAGARMMMISAAAQQWNVPEAELTTTGNGSVRHAASNRTATYASLATRFATVTPPALTAVKLKDPKDFKIIGKPIPGVDNQKIVTGQPLYSVDVNLPGMLYAVYEKCPVFGGTIVSANIDDVKKIPGVKHVFLIQPPAPAAPAAGAGGRGAPGGAPPANYPHGVAIVADNWWIAQNARKTLKPVWNEGAAASQSSVGYATAAKALAAESANAAPAGGGQNAGAGGDVEAAFAAAAAGGGKVIEAEYMIPLIAHAPLEPQNSTAHFKDGKLEIWSPSQIPGAPGPAAAAGITAADVTMHLVRAGGGFGRRLQSEYDNEVAKIARLVADELQTQGKPSVPVKLLWSREDDMQHDNYRPGGFHYFKAAVDNTGKLTAFRDFVGSVGSVVPTNEFPRTSVTNWSVTSRNVAPYSIPGGALRAPSTNGVSFIMQGFFDEIAVAAGKDPLQYRLDTLKLATAPAQLNPNTFNPARAIGVVEAVRDMSKWTTARAALPKGTGMGVAFQFAHAGYVAYVVEAAVDANKKLKVNRVWAAIDIGRQVVNTSMAKNLVEGGFVEAMSHVMGWEITIEGGKVTQTNFGQYNPARMSQIPTSIEVKFLQTDFNPTGLGEPSLPPAVPALVNAIAHATGVRVRSLPLKNAGYSWT
jgi:isoquinoline 1-oxidoreductase beta subunit